MAVNENDFELLSAYLDGELPVAECEGLWRRLAIERELMSELDTLRADHAVRGMMWSTLDPGDQSVARLESRVMRASRREDLLDRWHYVSRIITTVAALILFGFTVGWLGRERYIVSPTSTASINSNQPNHVASSLGIPQAPAPGKVSVEVDDGTGKLANFQFDTLDEANRFVHDFRANHPVTPPDTGDSGNVPPMDKF
jgi:anti-sigma factor RsiW